MNECFSKYFLLNEQLIRAELFEESLVYEGESVYEVIRISGGVPLFFSDHVARIESSARYQKKRVLAGKSELKSFLKVLLESDNKTDVNLKIVFNYNNGRENLLMYLLKPSYPTPEQYAKGVKGILYYAERKDPESKVINHKLRTEIYQNLISENAYEALLVNRHNCITEGSRSNIFFIDKGRLITAPDKEVLCGITRLHLIEICKENSIGVDFKCVSADELSGYESAFMTGTSPVVLPFSEIGQYYFNVNHKYLKILRDLYLQKADESKRDYEAIDIVPEM